MAALLAAVALAGCAGARLESTLAAGGVTTRTAELTGVPFHAQTAYHCGPAALATVLEDSGVPVTPDALAPHVYLPDRQGSLQAELLAAARRHGRLAYPLAPRLDALAREVSAGRPVLVLQDLGLGLARQWHYAVVIGFDRARAEIILRSGTIRRRLEPAGTFEASWRRAGRWAVIMLRPGELPAEVQRERYLRAAAPLEQAAQWPAAEAAWRAALAVWPRDTTARLGLANAEHAQDRPGAAAATLRAGLRDDPDSPELHNNLAHVLSGLGRHAEALDHARRAVQLGGANAATFERTLGEVSAASRADADTLGNRNENRESGNRDIHLLRQENRESGNRDIHLLRQGE